MKKFLSAAMIVASLFAASPAQAEVKNYDGVGEYVMSDFETPDVAKQRAKMYAERNACEKAGVYVKSYSRTENFELVADEVESMTSGVLKVVSCEFKMVPMEEYGGIMYRAVIVAQIDTANINEWISRGISERESLVEKNRELQRQIDEQERQIAELKKQATQSQNPDSNEKFQREFEQADKNFLSTVKLEEGNRLVLLNSDEAYEQALQAWTEAIELNPNNAAAYEARGYYFLYYAKNYSAGVDDYSHAIELHPSATNYFNRGSCMLNSGFVDAAKADFERALKINPNMSVALSEMAYIYATKDPLKAIEFANRALEFDERNWRAIYSRGLALFNMHNFEAALEDGFKALELGCGDAYQLIGDCYGMLNNRAEAEKYWELAKDPPAFG